MGRRCRVRRMIGSRIEAHGLEALEQRCFLTAAPGAEFLVNTWTADVQATNPAGAISADDAGNFVTVWESLNRDAAGSYGIYAQRYSADGTPAGAEFLVNTTLLSDQRTPAVAMNASGAFVVAWEGQGTLGPAFPGIYVQPYDATGAALGAEIAVAGTSLLSVNEAAVAMNASGAFVVVWEENGPTGRDIAARVYDASGAPIGAALTVNQTTAGNQRQPHVVMDSDGNFAVTWSGSGIGDDAGVFARLFGPTGTPLTDEVMLNTTPTGIQSFSAIARDANGQFMVVWSGNGTGDTAGVFARRMTASGVPTGSEFRISATITGTQQRPSVAFDPDGDYAVTWSGYGASDTSGIYAREYWSNDTPKATEFPVNTTTGLIQINASVISTGDNRYAATWSGPGTGDASGVFARLLVNVAPAVSTTGWSVDYTEDAMPVVADWGLMVSDADSMIVSATAQISVNYMPSEDSLVFADQLGITGSWNPLTGVLTLTGTASVWDYQTALQSVAYLNSSQNPSPAARTIAFAVNDGSLASTPATNEVTVTPVNDAPVAVSSPGFATYTVGGAAVPVDGAVVPSDVDSATLSSAVVQIVGNFAAGEDSLAFTAQAGITAVWDESAGTLTLSGAASVAAYREALRSVRYLNTSSDPSTLERTITILVMDDAGAVSEPVSREIELVAAPSPPPTLPPAPTPPWPPRAPTHPPCFHAHPVPPVARPPHVPPVAPPFSPPWRDGSATIARVRGVMPGHVADGILRIVGERLGATGAASAHRVVIELLNDSPRHAMGAWTSVISSALDPEAARHEQLGIGAMHSCVPEPDARQPSRKR